MSLTTQPKQQAIQPFDRVRCLLEKMKPQIANALPKHLTPDRMARIALTELRNVPALLKCSPESFVAAVMACSQLGLEPGSALGQIYLIPFGEKVQVILGFKGMIELSRRSGQIVSLSAHEVHEGDLFEFEYGLQEKLRHVPNLKDRGAMIAVYAVAHFVGGGHQIEVMSRADVEKIRAFSKAGNSKPWVDSFNEMAKKTVIRRLFKYLPISIEKLQMATMIDEEADKGTQDMKAIMMENMDDYVDAETGEVYEEPAQAEALAEKLK